ncbi:MAG: hypothetical protein WKG07_33805 [Hymenobacter sp.]
MDMAAMTIMGRATSIHLSPWRWRAARDLAKPNWYLPTWYGNTPSERFRLEQYLPFMTNLQGMMTPPDIDPFDPKSIPAAEGVVESNKLMASPGHHFHDYAGRRAPGGDALFAPRTW